MSSPADPPAPVSRQPTFRMLVIDDEEHIIAAISEYFATLGYQVDCARDEITAHALLDGSNYAVVITDLRLSRSDRIEGLEIIGRIRTRHSFTPCIVLTAHGGDENEKEAYRRGADAFLQKPTPLAAIAEIVAQLLDERSLPPRTPEAQL